MGSSKSKIKATNEDARSTDNMSLGDMYMEREDSSPETTRELIRAYVGSKNCSSRGQPDSSVVEVRSELRSVRSKRRSERTKRRSERTKRRCERTKRRSVESDVRIPKRYNVESLAGSLDHFDKMSSTGFTVSSSGRTRKSYALTKPGRTGKSFATTNSVSTVASTQSGESSVYPTQPGMVTRVCKIKHTDRDGNVNVTKKIRFVPKSNPTAFDERHERAVGTKEIAKLLRTRTA